MDQIRIIGDIHGDIDCYNHTISKCDYSVQLGDLGFDYSKIKENPHHKILKGNHDNYDMECPNDLGDFGVCNLNNIKFFFLRGAFSIDYKARIDYEAHYKKKVWWSQEELTQKQLYDAYDLYEKVMPDIVITHEAPDFVVKNLTNPETLEAFNFDPKTFNTNTQLALESMWELHQPLLWFFGHYHTNWEWVTKTTVFCCIDERNYVDLYQNQVNDRYEYWYDGKFRDGIRKV